MKGELPMTITERIENERQVNRPVNGNFPKKPESSKSLRNWLREGKCPRDGSSLRMYQMDWDPSKGYGYYDASDVRDMTEEEIAIVEKIYPTKDQASEKKEPSKKVTNPKCRLLSKEDWETKEIVVFDTETTGFSQYKDDILQISAADNHGHTLDLYVRPTKKRQWKDAEKVHHISPAMVANAPTAMQLAPRIQLLFDQADYIVGHNVGFDVRFVESCFGISIDPSKVIDTLDIFKMLYPNADNHKLETAVAMFASDAIKVQYADGAHSAIVDVLATLDVYKTFCKQA